VAAQPKRGMPGLGASVVVTALLMGAAGYAALYIAPTERSMGQIQRIFYMHMPSGINAFIAFFIAFIANIFYLAKRSPKADWLAVSAAEVGLALITVMLVTGPIWAKPVWGVWWVWDARLTSTFVLWVMYVSYLLLRGLIDDPERKATVSAVYGIFAFLDVPLVYMSTRWFRTQHPAPVVFGGPNSGLAPRIWQVLLFCMIAFAALMLVMLRLRYKLEQLRHEVAEMQVEAEQLAPAESLPTAAH
jgi:heme exporter protein C